MKPGPRLAALLSSAAVGCGLATVGAATAWYKTVQPTRVITTAIGTVHVRGAVHSHSPSDLGSPILPIAVLCLVFVLLAFLVGPRARTASVGLVVAGLIAILVLSFTVKKPSEAGATVQSAAGRILTPIGAVVGLAGAGAAFPLSTKVRRVRMPESGPAEGA